MGHQVAQGDDRTVVRRITNLLELGDVALNGIVETDLAVIAEPEKTEPGERLRDGSDSKNGVGRHLRVTRLRDSERVEELAIQHDAERERGQLLARGGRSERRLDRGKHRLRALFSY